MYLLPFLFTFSKLITPLLSQQIEPSQSHLIKQMPETSINTGFRHFCPIFRQPSLSSKGKILYPHLFSLSRHLGLPSRSWLTLSFFSLISRYCSIFKAFSMVLSKRKRPHRTVFPLYKVFIFSLFYSFPRLKIFAP